MGALIRLPRPSPFAYPGGNPGFDPSHPAASGMVPGLGFSGIPVGNNFVDLLTGQSGVVSGAPTKGVHGGVGPYANFALASATNVVTFSGRNTGAAPSGTTAGIVALNNVTSFNYCPLVLGASASPVFSVRISTSSLLCDQYGSPLSSALTTVGAPYFYVCSAGPAATNLLVVNLETGVIKMLAGTGGSLSANAAGTLLVGNRPSASDSLNGQLGPVMYSPAFLSMSQLLQWAKDPWSFWYP